MFYFSFLGGYTSVCLVWWLAIAGSNDRAWEASPFYQPMCAWVGEHWNIQAISGLPWLSFPARPSCISVLVRDVCGELGPVCPSSLGVLPPSHLGSWGQFTRSFYGCLRFHITWLNLWLIQWSFTPLNDHCGLRLESCVIYPFVSSQPCSFHWSLGWGWAFARPPAPLQTGRVLSGVSPAAFHSQPRPAGTPAPAELCVEVWTTPEWGALPSFLP